jgi:hypothetical protein
MKQSNEVRALLAAIRAARDPYPTTWAKPARHVREVRRDGNQRIDRLARAAREQH